MSETYTHTVGGFAVKLPFHPDDVQIALGVLRIYLPADGTTAAAQSRIDDAFTRALLTLHEQGRRRFEREELDAQYRYEQARGVAK
jgi:hypothetical protein